MKLFLWRTPIELAEGAEIIALFNRNKMQILDTDLIDQL